MQSSVAVGESPRVASAQSWVEPVKDPAGPSTRKRLVLKGLPVTTCSTAGAPREPAGGPVGHFRNGAAFAASVLSKLPSGLRPPMSSVLLMPLNAPVSAV